MSLFLLTPKQELSQKMAATVAGQTAAECTLAGPDLGFSSGEKSDCYLMFEALEAALKAVLHIVVPLSLVTMVLAKEV